MVYTLPGKVIKVKCVTPMETSNTSMHGTSSIPLASDELGEEGDL